MTRTNLQGIDWTAPATEVSDEVLARVQAAHPEWDWNRQMESAEAIVEGRLQ